MEKIKFRNHFRIIDPNGKVLFINSKVNKLGNYQYVSKFDTIAEAQKFRSAWATMTGRNPEEYKIERYSGNIKHEVPVVSNDANKILYDNKVFSGKGLKENTITPKRDENKYSPSRFYGRDVWMFQSTEHNKGTSVNKGKYKERHSFHDFKTFDTIKNLKNDGAMSLTFEIVRSLKSKHFNNRKEIKDYLRARKFTHRQINGILSKYYFKD